MCHAPIVLPEVAKQRANQVAKTTAAMHAAAAALLACNPDVVVIVSPHTPRHPHHWCIVQGKRLLGDLSRFGVPEVSLSLPVAAEAIETLHREAPSAGITTRRMPSEPLDHGAMVPLHFVVQAGWTGPTLLMALPYPETNTEVQMGELIAKAASVSGQKWAVLASGDMSHRLIPGAPAGYDPRAKQFDAAFAERIVAGDLRGATAVDPELRALAAEDVVDSVAVAAGAVAFDATGCKKLAYEGPFGVGYLEAILHQEEK